MGVETNRVRPRGRPRRSESDRAAHRERLVEAAMEAVRRFGPDTSIEQMADAAGVSKPVLYAEFTDKSGLVDAMAMVLALRVESTVVSRLSGRSERAFDHTIAAIVEALINLMVDEPQLYACIMRSFRMRDRGLVDNALSRVIRDRAQVILGDLADGMPPRDLDILGAGVFGFVFGVLELWMETGEPEKTELIELLTRSIRGGINAVAAPTSAPPPAADGT